MVRRALLTIALAGCGSFEDPDLVIDLRVLAMSASVPEQVVDVDIADPAPPIELLDQLAPTEVCVLVADLNFDRRLAYTMTLCNLDSALRCEDGRPRSVIGSGVWDDPDVTQPAPRPCATVPVDGDLLGIVLDSLETDALRGLGGIYYGVALRVGGEDADRELDLYAAKSLRVMPRIPSDVRANNNPSLDRIDVAIEGGEPAPLPLGRCVDQAAPLVVAPERKVRLTPIEPDGVRETYVVPTIDGKSRTFTESPTYQWLASAGKVSSGDTGGPRDAFGNPAPLFTEWTAPKAKDLAGPTDVALWIIQRDERLGVRWYESCLRAVP